MTYSKSKEIAIVLLLINVCIPLIVGTTGTYFYVRQHLRASAWHRTAISARSKFECAFICKKDEMCGIANYGNLNSICESMQEGRVVSDIATETTEKWEMLGKPIKNRAINNSLWLIDLHFLNIAF